MAGAKEHGHLGVMYLPLPLYTFKLTFIAGFSVEWRENGKQKRVFYRSKKTKKKTNEKLDDAKTLKENSSTTATSAAHASLATASRGSCL